MVLLIAGFITGILYAIYVNVRESSMVTLVAAPAEGGIKLDVPFT